MSQKVIAMRVLRLRSVFGVTAVKCDTKFLKCDRVILSVTNVAAVSCGESPKDVICCSQSSTTLANISDAFFNFNIS